MSTSVGFTCSPQIASHKACISCMTDYMAIKINWIIYTEPCFTKLNQSQWHLALQWSSPTVLYIPTHECAKLNYHILNIKEKCKDVRKKIRHLHQLNGSFVKSMYKHQRVKTLSGALIVKGIKCLNNVTVCDLWPPGYSTYPLSISPYEVTVVSTDELNLQPDVLKVWKQRPRLSFVTAALSCKRTHRTTSVWSSCRSVQHSHTPPPSVGVSVGGRLVALVSLWLGNLGDGIWLDLGPTGGVGWVCGGGVGGWVVGGGGICRRVRGVGVRRRFGVRWDGDLSDATTEANQGKVGQDSPSGDREEREGHGGTCSILRNPADIMCASPLTGQQAETYEPQEGPHPWEAQVCHHSIFSFLCTAHER